LCFFTGVERELDRRQLHAQSLSLSKDNFTRRTARTARGKEMGDGCCI
jgi:hypothetical protein